jgi:hypothetical protein
MVRTLAERMRAHEQQKARLAEQEAKLKDAERRARARRLIEASGLIDKAGLLDLDANALYGALLTLRDGADDKAQVGKWGRKKLWGGRERKASSWPQTTDGLPPCGRQTTLANPSRPLFRAIP